MAIIATPPRAPAPTQVRTRPRHSIARPVFGILLLPWLGIVLEALILALWPVSYDLTQGVDFSYEYLLQYDQVWEWFRPLLQRFEALLPTAATSLEQLTTLLSLFWIASFLVYIAAFFLLRSLPGGSWAVVLVAGFTVLFQVTYFLMPGTFTTDLFSYAMYGIIPGVYDLNPYIYVPGYFPANRMTSWIHPIWYYTPSIYGPVWLDLSVWLTSFTRDRSLVDQALIYRIVSNLAHLVNIGLVGALLRRLAPPRPASLLLLVAWNPLLLFEFAASGHNDSFMLTWLLLACVLLAYRRHLVAVASLALSALVKVTPMLLLPLIAVQWTAQQPTRRRQLGVLALSGAIPLALAVVLYKPWYSGPDTFMLIDYWSKGPMYMNYVPDLLAQWVAEHVLDPAQVNPDAALELARTGMKWITRILFLAYFGWEVVRLWRYERAACSTPPAARGEPAAQRLLAAMSRVFLVFLLLVNTWVLPWYITWPFFLAVPLGWGRLETRIAAGFTFTAPLMMYNHHYWSIHMPDWLYGVYLAPLLLLVPPLGRRLLQRRPRSRSSRLSTDPTQVDRPAGETGTAPAAS